MLTRFAAVFCLVTMGACDWGSPGGGPTGGDRDGGTNDDVDPNMPAPEVCDQVDNNRDGFVDEACACATGATQTCWPGLPGQRNVGVCRDGMQTCVGEAEFSDWSSCEGAVPPGEETG